MAIHYFIWNNGDSRNAKVRVHEPTPIIRPEERVTHVSIPGRLGEVTQTEGDNIFNSYIQTVSVTVEGADYAKAAGTWLRGAGNVTFSTQPTLTQKARVINAVTFTRLSRNLDLWSGEVQFYCDPVKYDTTENTQTIAESGASITSTGDLVSYPLMTVSGSGAVTISMGGKTLVIPSLTDGSVIDSDLQWLLVNNVPQLGWSGDFPVINPGANTLAFTGNITSITLTPRIRYL